MQCLVRSPFRRLTFCVKDPGYVGFICEVLPYGMMVSFTQGLNSWKESPCIMGDGWHKGLRFNYLNKRKISFSKSYIYWKDPFLSGRGLV